MTVVSEKTRPSKLPHVPNVPIKHGPVHAAGTTPSGNRPSTKTHTAHPAVDPTQDPTKGLAAFRTCRSSGNLAPAAAACGATVTRGSLIGTSNRLESKSQIQF